MIAVPQTAIMLAKRFEGFHRVPKHDPGRAYPYVCPAGYWTIGWGHLCDQNHPPVTEAEGETYLAADLTTALAATLRYCPDCAYDAKLKLISSFDQRKQKLPGHSAQSFTCTQMSRSSSPNSVIKSIAIASASGKRPRTFTR